MLATVRAATLVALALLLSWPEAAVAQGRYNLLLSLAGGLGGSLDEDDAGFGNSALQIGLAMETSDKRVLGLRVGRLSLDKEDLLGSLSDASLDYVTVGGEYRFDEGIYTSGLFLGLGAYRIEGRLPTGAREEDTVLGLTLGGNGLFDVTRRVSIFGEISAHLLDSQIAEIFAMALGGVAIHF